MFHLGSSAGYAIDSLLASFVQMAEVLTGGRENIHVSFTRLEEDYINETLHGLSKIIEFDPSSNDASQKEFIKNYVRKNGIDMVLGFDQPVWQPTYRHLRKAGVRKIVSYLGAPMSDLNKGVKLMLKKLEVWATPGSPDHYIFESMAMAKTAYQGRGIPKHLVSVVYMGVNTTKFTPSEEETFYAHDAFGIPRSRKIIYYSGHMEERKGVAVLVKAAKHLYESHGHRDYHFLILGNQDGQEQRYIELLDESRARNHVTFGGYRKDISEILPSCSIGVIASTGWDSFTVSSLEIAACGLPLIVSSLQGLVETIEEGETGISFQPGNHEALAGHILTLLNNHETRQLMGRNARRRILAGFSKDMQIANMVDVMKKVLIT